MNPIRPLRVSKTLFEELNTMSCGGNFHSVFKNCVNGLSDGNHSFNIASDKVWINPRSIQISQGDWDDIQMKDLKVGDRFYIRGQTLCIPTLSSKIDLKKAILWNPEETSLPDIRPEAQILRNIEAARVALHESEGSSSFPGTFIRIFEERVSSLRRGIGEGSFLRTKEAIASLIGFGPGLTPSGDDFILGFIASVHFWGKFEMKGIFDAIVTTAKDKTTFISQEMLSDGVLGRFSFPVIELMESLLAKDEENSFVKARNLLTLGATSGCDILKGVLWGMDLSLDLQKKGNLEWQG